MRNWRIPALLLASAGLLLGACDDSGGPGNEAVVIYGVTPDNELVHFNVESPETVTGVPITGLGAGEAIRAIDFRVSDGDLFGLGSDGLVYRINRSNGAATPLSDTLDAVAVGSTFGFDLNPTINRLRIITDGDSSLRVNPDDGNRSATDSPVAYEPSDSNSGENPAIVGAAYSNNTADAVTTSLYVIDQQTDDLVLVSPPNNGVLLTIGHLGVNVTGDIGFDIAPNGIAYAALVVQGSSDPALYTINLSTGAATLVGPINSARLTGISVRP